MSLVNYYSSEASENGLRPKGILGKIASTGAGGAETLLKFYAIFMNISLLLVFPVYFIYKEKEAECQKKWITMTSNYISNYSILVRGLPLDSYSEEIVEYFESRGYSVHEVSMIFSRVKKSGNLSEDNISLTESLNRKTLNFNSSEEHVFTGVAFITFNCLMDAKDLLSRYRLTWWNYILWIMMKSGLVFSNVIITTRKKQNCNWASPRINRCRLEQSPIYWYIKKYLW